MSNKMLRIKYPTHARLMFQAMGVTFVGIGGKEYQIADMNDEEVVIAANTVANWSSYRYKPKPKWYTTIINKMKKQDRKS